MRVEIFHLLPQKPSDDDDDDDCSEEMHSEATIPDTPPIQPKEELSEYELKIQKNIQQRFDFLSSLGIDEAKEDILSLSPLPCAATPQQRGIAKIKTKRPSPPAERRLSLRLQSKPAEAVTPLKDIEVTEPENERPEAGENLITYINEKLSVEQGTEMLQSVQTKFKPASSNSWTGNLSTMMNKLRNLRVTEETIAKVVPGRIMSLAVHPSNTDDIVLTGDKNGYLGKTVPGLLSK